MLKYIYSKCAKEWEDLNALHPYSTYTQGEWGVNAIIRYF